MSPPCGQIHVNLHNRYHSFKEGCYPSGTAVTCQHICNGVHQNCKTQRKEKGDGKIFSYKITLNILVDGVNGWLFHRLFFHTCQESWRKIDFLNFSSASAHRRCLSRSLSRFVFPSSWFAAHELSHTNTQTHKYTNTQIHKYTNTQLHKHTNTLIQIHKYWVASWSLPF